MSKREKNKLIEKTSLIIHKHFNTNIPIQFSKTTKHNLNNDININKIKLILESHNKAFHKRSHSTSQNINSTKNSKKKLNPENSTNKPMPLNKFYTNSNRSKDKDSSSSNLKIESYEKVEPKDNFNKSKTYNQTVNLFNNIKVNNSNIINNSNINKIFSRSLSPEERININKKQYLLPEKTSNKKTLVLDLDETLVHSVGGIGDMNGTIPQSDFTIQVPQINSTHDVHVNVRPHVEEFLERMSKRYELVIFTASISKYANPLLNIVDKMGHVPFRLFREHCTLINTAFVKDLSLLGRDFKDIIILDNNPTAYSLNHYNGFPIKSWFDDKNDDELLKICPILEFLSYVPDVRDYIKKIVVQNKVQFDSVKQIIINYKNNMKKYIIPPECKKIYDLFDDEKCNNNLIINNNLDKIMQKSKSTKISIIKSSSNHTNKSYNNKKINDFTNINIVNKSSKYNRIFSFDELNNSINLPKHKPIKINNINMKIVKNKLRAKKSLKKKNSSINHNIFLKKKKLVINTMRYNYPKNKILTSKNSKNISSNYIINNINNININISNNFSDIKNNMTENINNNDDCLKNKQIVFKNNDFFKSNKNVTPKIMNTRNDVIFIKEFNKDNSENKNELNISKNGQNKNNKVKVKNKIQLLNMEGSIKI